MTLPDGSRKQLIEINQEIEVRLLSGGTAPVEATTLDVHDIDIGHTTDQELARLAIEALAEALIEGERLSRRRLRHGAEERIARALEAIEAHLSANSSKPSDAGSFAEVGSLDEFKL